MERERSFTRYVKSENTFQPIGETRDVLPSGFYEPVYDSYHGKAFFSRKEIIMPKLYILPNDIQTTILDDIKRFWESEDRYRQFGNVYKRNILLYSLPGNGKTSLINILAHKLIEEYDGIVIFIDNTQALSSYHVCMERLRDIEPNRKIVTIIEDFERLSKDDHYTAMLLQLLDGNTQFDNVVTIATTNYPQILEKRFTCRPSRFNLVIEYKKPTEDVRRAYITMKLKDAGLDVEDETIKKDIERYTVKTEGFTFDFLKEVIQGIYVDQIPEVTLFERLNEIIKKNGRITVTEEEVKQIGFSTGGTLSNSESYATEPADPIKEDEDEDVSEGWAIRPVKQLPANVQVKGFVPSTTQEAFDEAIPLDELIEQRNKIMKEWSEGEKDAKND